MMRRGVALLLKAAITAGLLYFAVGRANWGVLGDRLNRLDLTWMMLAVAIGIVQLGLVSVRWRLIAERCGAALALPRAFRFSLIGHFFSQVLPSTVGGDAVRIWLFARDGAGWSKAAYSVLLDRFIGVLVLAAMVVASLPWSFDLIKSPIGRTMLLVIGLGSIGGGLVFLAMGYLQSSWLAKWPPTRHLAHMAVTAKDLLRTAQPGVPLIGISLAVHVLSATAAWSAAQAVAAPVGFLQVFLLLAPVSMIATVPISIAGWGVRESALVLAFSYAGLPESDALIISVLFGAATFATGVIGGLVWLASGGALRLSAAWRNAQPPLE
jgi:uncharacterized membrane protein YbhN (UPF0104 family)